MGKYKEMLLEEQQRITGNWREQDHYEYLAWRKSLEEQEYEYEERRKNSRGEEQGDCEDSMG